jgi:hypothetical protein
MIVYLLTLFLAGASLGNQAVLSSKQKCNDLGDSLIAGVGDVWPDRAARMSFECTALVMDQPLVNQEPKP